MARAIADSREKAQIIAREADLKLGAIQNVDYSWQQMQIYSEPMLLADGEGAFGAKMSRSMDIDIEAADINIEDTVTIMWAVE